jgi:phage baseplate assembly protein W
VAQRSKKETFSDISLAFTPHPITGGLTRKIDRESVRQSVKSLILTDFYERPFKPDIGCSIRSFLFELWTPVVQQQMEEAIYEVIRNYEPRAEVLRVVVQDRSELNALTVSVAFRIKNDPTPIILDVILERVR